jgi:hypothetical protein
MDELQNTVLLEKKKGRPKKYATPEEAHQAQILKMKENYAKQKENKEIIVKNKLSGDEIRTKNNERLRKWRQKKKEEKS